MPNLTCHLLFWRRFSIELLWPVTGEKKILVDYLAGESSRHSRPKRLYAKIYLQNTSRLRKTIDLLYLTVGELEIARKGR